MQYGWVDTHARWKSKDTHLIFCQVVPETALGHAGNLLTKVLKDVNECRSVP